MTTQVFTAEQLERLRGLPEIGRDELQILDAMRARRQVGSRLAH